MGRPTNGLNGPTGRTANIKKRIKNIVSNGDIVNGDKDLLLMLKKPSHKLTMIMLTLRYRYFQH